MIRPRACGALIQDNVILMVQHVEPSRSYWTLPGGGIEAGESPAEAAMREVWEGSYGHGGRISPEYCYLVELEADRDGPAAATLGLDHEEAHLASDQRLLQGVAWVPLTDLKGDAQVARVLMALNETKGGERR
jgi:8-oxo-dGTP diphosphatase